MKIRLGSRSHGLAPLALTVALAAFALAVPGAQHAALAQTSSTGYVGVLLQDLNDDLRDSYNFKGTGVLISDVTDGSPADHAGLKRGDIVTSYRGRSVSSSEQLTNLVRADKAGDRAALTVWREGKPNTVTVTLGSRADMPRDEDNDNDNDNDHYNNNGHHGTTRTRTYSYSMPKMPMLDMMGTGPRLGVETQDLDQDLGGYFNRPTGKGVLVTHVLDDTPAKRSGLRSGDVIIEVGGKAVDDTGDLRDALRDRDSGPVSLTVLRKGSRQTLTATLEERHGSMSDDMGRAWIMSHDGHVQSSPGMSDRERQELQRQMDDLRRQLDDLRKQMHTRD